MVTTPENPQQPPKGVGLVVLPCPGLTGGRGKSSPLSWASSLIGTRISEGLAVPVMLKHSPSCWGPQSANFHSAQLAGRQDDGCLVKTPKTLVFRFLAPPSVGGNHVFHAARWESSVSSMAFKPWCGGSGWAGKEGELTNSHLMEGLL